jgi:hypothetical protein
VDYLVKPSNVGSGEIEGRVVRRGAGRVKVTPRETGRLATAAPERDDCFAVCNAPLDIGVRSV